jgi:hypothetical protein
MKKLLLYFIGSTWICDTNAQVNLVPNYSFEDTTQCPNLFGQIYYAVHWTDPTNASSDLYNSCANNNVGVPFNGEGFQVPNTGNGYAGFITYSQGVDFHEYIQAQLDSQLQSSKTYYVEFYMSMADTQTVAANNVGAYFSSNAITGPSGPVLNYTPQISNDPIGNPLTSKTNWTKVSGSFVASGTENYITIGNFLNDVSTDTVYVGGGCCDASYYYIDDVSVICLDCDTTAGIDELSNEMYFNLFPNPNDGAMNFSYALEEEENGTFSIYDLAGKLMFEYTLQKGNDQLLFIDEDNLSNGIYFYKVMIDQQMELSEKIVIIK